MTARASGKRWRGLIVFFTYRLRLVTEVAKTSLRMSDLKLNMGGNSSQRLHKLSTTEDYRQPRVGEITRTGQELRC